MQRTRPDILVESDASQEITKVVEELGWHPEPSLANKWPHNTVHERWTGTCKSVIRASILQSGLRQQILLWVLSYASIVLSIVQPAPIMRQEEDTTGNILKEYEWKKEHTCWKVHHDGKELEGQMPLRGQLCYYLNRENHTCMPRTSAGIFVGWQLESGLRYRMTL